MDMKRVLNKPISLAVIVAMFFSMFVPMMVSASKYALGEEIRNSNGLINEIYQYNVTPNEVTLYIGDISINHGEKHRRYLYTDKAVNEQTLRQIRDILTIDYRKLLPNQPGQILVNNFNADMSRGNWKSAYDIARGYYRGAKVEGLEYPDKSIYYKATLNKLRRENKQEYEQEKQSKLNILGENQNVNFAHFVFNSDIDLTDNDSFMVDCLKESNAQFWLLGNDKKAADEKLSYQNLNHSVKVFDIDRTIVRVVSTSATVKLPKKISEINMSLKAPTVGQEVNLTVNDDGSEIPDERPLVEINAKGFRYKYASMWLKRDHNIHRVGDIDDSSAFVGRFEENKEYEALIWINIDAPYGVADRANVLVNGKPATECIAVGNGIVVVVAKVEAEK